MPPRVPQRRNFYELQKNGSWEAFPNSLKISALYLRKKNPKKGQIYFGFPQTPHRHEQNQYDFLRNLVAFVRELRLG